MSAKTKAIRLAVRDALIAAGATDLSFELCGNSHQRYNFMAGGRKGRFCFASTPKSDRAITNAAAVARRTVREYLEGRRGQKQMDVEAVRAVGASVPG